MSLLSEQNSVWRMKRGKLVPNTTNKNGYNMESVCEPKTGLHHYVKKNKWKIVLAQESLCTK
jgi:hypothetical protein